MSKVNQYLPRRNSDLSKNDAKTKYNASNPVIVDLEDDEGHRTGGTMVATNFMVQRAFVGGREVIQVTFVGSGNLTSFTVLYPLEFAKYLAPAFMGIAEGVEAVNETNLNW